MRVKLVDPLHPTMRVPLGAIGLRADGSPLWPLCGADGEGDEGGDDEGSEGDEEDESEGDEEDDDDAEDKDSKSTKGKKKTGPVSREEFDAVTRRLSAADKRRAEAEKTAATLKKEKEDQERKGKPELENLRKDHDTLTKDHETLQSKFTKLARTNAFLTASAQEKITWHDPRVALRSADLDDLEIDDDGNVDGINDVVKALAKKHAYLVNKAKAEADEDEGDKTTRKRGASGSGVGSVKSPKGKPANGKLTDEQLKARFPALK